MKWEAVKFVANLSILKCDGKHVATGETQNVLPIVTGMNELEALREGMNKIINLCNDESILEAQDIAREALKSTTQQTEK